MTDSRREAPSAPTPPREERLTLADVQRLAGVGPARARRDDSEPTWELDEFCTAASMLLARMTAPALSRTPSECDYCGAAAAKGHLVVPRAICHDCGKRLVEKPYTEAPDDNA